MFIHTSLQGRTILLLYVGDMIITGDDLDHIKFIMQYLQHHFEMNDLGPLRYFLGLKVVYSHRGYFLSRNTELILSLALA